MAEFKQYGSRVQVSDEVTTARESKRVSDATAKAEADATEATRLAKRPKRSQINALKSKAANDSSNAATKETVKLLIDMMDSVIAFQNVDVDEDEA